MSVLPLYEPASSEYFHYFSSLYQLKEIIPRPQEDSYCISNDLPIFAVADGVTLVAHLLTGIPYPDPSPAGQLAELTAKTLVSSCEKSYKNFSLTDIARAFLAANTAAAELNSSLGRNPTSSDYWLNDIYAATAALVVIKPPFVYWGTICDSYVATYTKTNQQIFISPDPSSVVQDPISPLPTSHDHQTRYQFSWKNRRNRLDNSGKTVGYGVVTGEPAALNYVSSGKLPYSSENITLILTDGFKPFLDLPNFIPLFKNPDIHKITSFTSPLSHTQPDIYGHERTLIGITG